MPRSGSKTLTATRKGKNTCNVDILESSQESVAEGKNVNDNHLDASNRKRHLSDASLKEIKGKRVKTKKKQQTADQPDHEFNEHNVEMIEFDEGENTVVIGVRDREWKEFPSEDEDESSGSEDDEEGEIQSDSSGVENSDGPTTDYKMEERTPVKKKTKRKSTHRRSVEDKIDELSSTVKAMQ